MNAPPGFGLALKIWRLANKTRTVSFGINGGMSNPLVLSEIAILCEIYGASQKDFEVVVGIEEVMLPIIQEKEKDARDKNKARN